MARSQPSPSIILISVDTLRADHLSCYGYNRWHTPNIDALTRGGSLFLQVSSQVPLTLPSHVSMLTSSYPFANGITDNGQQLEPGQVSLASILKSHGYGTAAFVGGFVLDRRFGLNQGFDIYDSPFSLHRQKKADPGEIKRFAEDVVGSATAWLQDNSAGPFFLFLHLYDLHTPYELPPGQEKQIGLRGYDAQLAYVDIVLGGLWDYLKRKGLMEKTLIVFTSDHGEGLGDHSESTHGYYIYQSTLRVPLIFHWPQDSNRFLTLVDAPVSVLDIAPTLLQYAGIPQPAAFQGRSLLGLVMQKQPISTPAEIYSESLYARSHFGCSSLQSLRFGHYKYIEAPKPELYDLSKDPDEKQNLYSLKKSVALSLRGRLQGLRSRYRAVPSDQSRPISPEVVDALNSLGYVAVSSATSDLAESHPDPKERIHDFESMNHAILLASLGRLEEANTQLQQLRNKFPEVSDIRIFLGINQQRLNAHREAAQTFREILKKDSLNVLAHFNLAVSCFKLQQLDEAIKELHAVLAIAPYYSHADELLGTIWLQAKDYERARTQFKHLLSVDPQDYTAHYNLGVMATLEGKWDEGEQHLRSALLADPDSAEAYNSLGSLFLQRGDLEMARQAFLKTIGLDPKMAGAHYNLGLVLRKQNKQDEAAAAFRRALSLDPHLSAARKALDGLEQAPK